MAWILLNYVRLEKKLEVHYSMEGTNTAQAFKVNYDTSEEELLSVPEIKTMEKHIDHCDEGTRFFTGLIVSGFFSLLLWAAIFWVIT